jgi:hypothetical protein
LTLQGADVIEPGAGYTVPPVVTIGTEWQANTAYSTDQQIYYLGNLYTVQDGGTTGDKAPTFVNGVQLNGTATLAYAGSTAFAVARVNTAGQVVEIIVIETGSGYTVTPTITISGGNGLGARAVPVLGNELVRNFLTTIKYDRYNYNSQVVDWQTNTEYLEGQLVRFQDQVYSVDADVNSGSIFDPEQYTLVDQSTLDAADRVIGLYTPTPNEPGRELAQVMLGIDYPGVQVMGPDFSQNTGYDVGSRVKNNFSVPPSTDPVYNSLISAGDPTTVGWSPLYVYNAETNTTTVIDRSDVTVYPVQTADNWVAD